jgi:hypothetical protein
MKMKLPFTVEQFYGVFHDYNETVWPAQWFLLGMAVLAIWFVAWRGRWSGRAVSAILALLWIWMGVVYHFIFFASINPLAYAFSVASLMGALVFMWQGVILGHLRFSVRNEAHAYLGGALIVFALVVYPAWSWLAGHIYPAMPTFGLPCPTTIFTIGILAFRTAPYPRGPLIVPLLWSLVGAQAAFLLGVPQDLGLLAAAAIGVMLLVRKRTSGLRRKHAAAGSALH